MWRRSRCAYPFSEAPHPCTFVDVVQDVIKGPAAMGEISNGLLVRALLPRRRLALEQVMVDVPLHLTCAMARFVVIAAHEEVAMLVAN